MICILYAFCRIKENEEATIRTVQEAVTVTEFSPLPDEFFTQPVQLAKSKFEKLFILFYKLHFVIQDENLLTFDI